MERLRGKGERCIKYNIMVVRWIDINVNLIFSHYSNYRFSLSSSAQRQRAYSQIMESKTFCSVRLKFIPMHCLDPLLKGSHVKPVCWSCSPPCSNRSGINSSGWCQIFGFMWIELKSILIFCPLEIKVPFRLMSCAASLESSLSTGPYLRRFFVGGTWVDSNLISVYEHKPLWWSMSCNPFFSNLPL